MIKRFVPELRDRACARVLWIALHQPQANGFVGLGRAVITLRKEEIGCRPFATLRVQHLGALYCRHLFASRQAARIDFRVFIFRWLRRRGLAG